MDIRWLYISTMTLSVMACSNDGPSNIQVRNASDHDWKNLVVANESFGSLAAHSDTEPRAFEVAFRYAYVSFEAADRPFVLQPIDFVGEEPLGSGNFVYVVTIRDFAAGTLDMEMVE